MSTSVPVRAVEPACALGCPSRLHHPSERNSGLRPVLIQTQLVQVEFDLFTPEWLDCILSSFRPHECTSLHWHPLQATDSSAGSTTWHWQCTRLIDVRRWSGVHPSWLNLAPEQQSRLLPSAFHGLQSQLSSHSTVRTVGARHCKIRLAMDDLQLILPVHGVIELISLAYSNSGRPSPCTTELPMALATFHCTFQLQRFGCSLSWPKSTCVFLNDLKWSATALQFHSQILVLAHPLHWTVPPICIGASW